MPTDTSKEMAALDQVEQTHGCRCGECVKALRLLKGLIERVGRGVEVVAFQSPSDAWHAHEGCIDETIGGFRAILLLPPEAEGGAG